jgi:hypothetical protein
MSRGFQVLGRFFGKKVKAGMLSCISRKTRYIVGNLNLLEKIDNENKSIFGSSVRTVFFFALRFGTKHRRSESTIGS